MVEALFWPALLGYGEAALAYSSPRFTRFGTWGVRLGWLAQSALLGVQAARAARAPDRADRRRLAATADARSRGRLHAARAERRWVRRADGGDGRHLARLRRLPRRSSVRTPRRVRCDCRLRARDPGPHRPC